MSSITKEWNEEDFRKELRRLDRYVISEAKALILWAVSLI